MTTTRTNDNYQKIGAVWQKSGRNGQFLCGKINEDIDAGDMIFIFKNERKRESNHPDYNIFRKQNGNGGA